MEKRLKKFIGDTDPNELVNILGKDNFKKIAQFINNADENMQIVFTPFSSKDEFTVKKQHIIEIMKVIIYSIKQTLKGGLHGDDIHCINGFIDRYGRLPNMDDEFHIIRGKYFLSKKCHNGQMGFYSEFNFYIK